MYEDMDVANYIIELYLDKGKTINAHILQKELYKANEHYLRYTGTSLVVGEFKNNATNSYLESVYRNFRHLNNNPIKSVVPYITMDLDGNLFISDYTNDVLDKQDRVLLKQVCCDF